MSRGYTNIAAVEALLGGAGLDTNAQAVASTLLDATEVKIDRETRHTWKTPRITAPGERYDMVWPVLYLKAHPVATVDVIQIRSTRVGDTLTTLIAGTDYELIDPNLGEIHFASGLAAPDPQSPYVINQFQNRDRDKVLAFVQYTPNNPVPADIARCATLIVAHSLYLTLNPERLGISVAKLDTDTVMTYFEGDMRLAVPEAAQRIIDGYAGPIIA